MQLFQDKYFEKIEPCFAGQATKCFIIVDFLRIRKEFLEQNIVRRCLRIGQVSTNVNFFKERGTLISLLEQI